MNHTTIVRIAVTLPRREYRLLEAARKGDGETRSAAILRSIRHWLEWRETRRKVLRYQKGYREYPESVQERKVLERLQAAALEAEDWS